MLSALANCELTALEARQSASLICFDVEKNDLAQLNQVALEGRNWTEFTELCLQRKQQVAYQGGTFCSRTCQGQVGTQPTRRGARWRDAWGVSG
jgi:hypothetical protein